ncbi:MAG: 2,3,4,5-tetrahydropyridine-2,6-dicarboxylate N-succinyltransferase [Holosporaceae bacterium]|jgi:2,3,4,5-tetrahydropyridine-2-carboxylate N-succinyltransferase|nr:2,3,4,5-tetrahydropyridine-2,6-dicarboxylate N-succinyltransferase [Holosporaceae bacterium]
MSEELQKKIEALWENDEEDRACVQKVLDGLDSGELRLAQKENGIWTVKEYLKKAILLYLRHTKSTVMYGNGGNFFDKMPLKTCNWEKANFELAGFRTVPGSIIRYSAYVAASSVIMPCFINVGAFIDEGSMIDAHASVGSCAQIGRRCHISDGVTIGGVLEPPQAIPVIIEDNCFIGARSAVLEGVIVEEGSVLAAGTILSASTKIINRETGSADFGRIPPYSVVVPGSYPSGGVNICCAVIVKRVDAQTRRKVSINELLRY